MSFSLPTIADLSDLIVKEGRDCYIWSIDLARAYRQLRTCPLSTPLLGIRHDNAFYVDVCPSFGCRTSAMVCSRTTSAVVWLMRQRGFTVLCYLDDFVGVAKTEALAKEAYHTLLALLKYLGLNVSLHKCIEPTHLLTWRTHQT